MDELAVEVCGENGAYYKVRIAVSAVPWAATGHDIPLLLNEGSSRRRRTHRGRKEGRAVTIFLWCAAAVYF